MRVAFVGIKRPFSTIPDEIGIDLQTFVRFHLEMPYYFSRYGDNEVFITTVDTGPGDGEGWLDNLWEGDDDMWPEAHVNLVRESWLKDSMSVVVHWRSWQQWAYDQCPSALHVIQTCDHTYPDEWKSTVRHALSTGMLSRIIAFETWHVRQLQQELDVDFSNFVTQVHLGVDTDIYRPTEKDPYRMLWASDPGRGLSKCLEVFQHLYQRDRRWNLHVTYPDYVKDHPTIMHPGIKVYSGLRNGPKLWDLFNTSMFVPYTSCFPEPSSRVHRQGQAAGAVVMYPSEMGSPSELIINGRTGVVVPKIFNAAGWTMTIERVMKEDKHLSIGTQARMFAVTEDWSVQAERFNRVCRELLR